MKKILYSAFIVGAMFFNNKAISQDCSSGDRYSQEVFDDVIVIKDIEYGENYKADGVTIEKLMLDIYMPDNDTDTDRPVILLAHGGSFIGGSRDQLDDMCTDIAKMGYVTVTMSYRLLNILTDVDFLNVGLSFKKEVVRAIHDMKAAVRFMRKSYEDGNEYGINPDIIITGGVSAGAILSNHVVYLDDLSKIDDQPDLVDYINNQGGLEGESGNPGYSSVSQMALSMCGALMDTTIMTAGQQPFYGVHTAEDQTVPYLFGQPDIGIPIPVDLYGDSLIHKRALNLGVNSSYKHYETGGHCDFDTDFFNHMMDFVYENVCVQSLSIASNPNKVVFSVYPNPATHEVVIDIPGNEWNSDLTIIDGLGQVVYTKSLNSFQSVYTIDVNNFNAGIYHVRLTTDKGQTSVKKLVVQ